MLAAIQLQVKAALNYDKLLAKLRNSEGERSIRDQQNALITSLNLKLSGISKKRTRLYEDFTEGILDEEEDVYKRQVIAVVDGNKADAHEWKSAFQIVSRFNVVTRKAGKVFDADQVNLAALDLLHQMCIRDR